MELPPSRGGGKHGLRSSGEVISLVDDEPVERQRTRKRRRVPSSNVSARRFVSGGYSEDQQLQRALALSIGAPDPSLGAHADAELSLALADSARLERLAADRRLRESQDAEARLSMALDRSRSEERRRAAASKSDISELDATTKRALEVSEQAAVEALAAALPEEPADGGVRCKVRFTDGRILSRRFLADAPLAELFAFVEVNDARCRTAAYSLAVPLSKTPPLDSRDAELRSLPIGPSGVDGSVFRVDLRVENLAASAERGTSSRGVKDAHES